MSKAPPEKYVDPVDGLVHLSKRVSTIKGSIEGPVRQIAHLGYCRVSMVRFTAVDVVKGRLEALGENPPVTCMACLSVYEEEWPSK